ncbi:MAG: class I SAM-dependent methyltransferase [Spirochaetes bacterium]|nr:class I SAM-dependent methyltransferase [Spirochaetota bacterium]
MKLSKKEFGAMNNSFRRFLQRSYEYPLFKKFGLAEKRKRILEIGCGSGYGAALMAELEPSWYAGIDLMPEQVELARGRNLPGCEFEVMDATDLSRFANGSVDAVVVFGILHHIPEWRKVVGEIWRVLARGGKLFIEEPDGRFVAAWDRLFKWGHPVPGFRLSELEEVMKRTGFSIRKRRKMFGFGTYAAVKE